MKMFNVLDATGTYDGTWLTLTLPGGWEYRTDTYAPPGGPAARYEIHASDLRRDVVGWLVVASDPTEHDVQVPVFDIMIDAWAMGHADALQDMIIDGCGGCTSDCDPTTGVCVKG